MLAFQAIGGVPFKFYVNVTLRITVELFANPSFSVKLIDRVNVFAALVVWNVTD